jgi:hypothetical protein
MRVNFYILTFKQKIIVAFLIVLSLFITLNELLYYMVNHKINKEYYIDKKVAKIQHFQLNEPFNKDIVFIGSSRTSINISSTVFNETGLKTYNLGVSARHIEDFYYYIPFMKRYKPKVVIISEPVYVLYKSLPLPSEPTLVDLQAYWKLDKIYFLKSLILYIKNLNLFYVYSENIFYKLKQVYNKFNIKNDEQQASKNMNLSTDAVNCKIVNLQSHKHNLMDGKCANGDSFMLGNFPTKTSKKEKILNKLNEQTISFINKFSKVLKDSGIKFVFILEPTVFEHYSYDLTDINKNLKNTEVVDFSNLEIPKKMISESNHFNIYGKYYYSKILFKELKKRNTL